VTLFTWNDQNGLDLMILSTRERIVESEEPVSNEEKENNDDDNDGCYLDIR